MPPRIERSLKKPSPSKLPAPTLGLGCCCCFQPLGLSCCRRHETKVRQLEAQHQKLADDLKLRELELKTAHERLAEEAKGKSDGDKVVIGCASSTRHYLL